MSKNRKFDGTPTTRLIVSVEQSTVAAVDALINYPWGNDHPVRGNRAEFVPLAIQEKLERDLAAKMLNTV
ncbi:toxin-antitoxin system protein [Aquitalea denitrificans]|uniref:toxin-antitoxin system protein n=1 Tax=Aquitalea denitrificans TaxID=519081 RepID=UPI001358C9B9|nr:toxin-antitoxin system protein [Aquitalea denitrificans]